MADTALTLDPGAPLAAACYSCPVPVCIANPSRRLSPVIVCLGMSARHARCEGEHASQWKRRVSDEVARFTWQRCKCEETIEMVPFIVSVWRRGAGSALMRYSIRACDEVVAGHVRRRCPSVWVIPGASTPMPSSLHPYSLKFPYTLVNWKNTPTVSSSSAVPIASNQRGFSVMQ